MDRDSTFRTPVVRESLKLIHESFMPYLVCIERFLYIILFLIYSPDDVEKIVDPEQFNTILEEAEFESSKDPVSWRADETLKLIEAYKKHKHKFANCSSRRFVWNIISSELANQGLNRDAEKLENKWKSLLRSYRRGETRKDSPRFYFYEKMCEALNGDKQGSSTKNDINAKEYLEEDSLDKAETAFENSDHAYNENAGYEQIIIETEPTETEENDKWSNAEMSTLLSTFSNCKDKFKDLGKAKLWEQVAKELSTLGINKTSEQCQRKWKKMFGIYRIHKLNKLGSSGFPFYQEIDDILKKDMVMVGGNDETVLLSKRCKCTEKRILDKQNRHMERMEMLKRKLDLEERKVEAFEVYVKHLRSSSS